MMNSLPQTILIVEDEVLIARAQTIFLKKEGFEIIHVTSGEQALKIVDNQFESINLILMDINLGSGIDGIETSQEILKHHCIPILFLSSHTEKEVVERTGKVTSYGYVVKNSGNRVLLASIKMAFKLFNAHLELELKKRELQRIEERNEAIINAIPDLLFILDRQGVFIDCRTRYPRELFAPFESFIGKGVSEVMPEEIARLSQEKIRMALDTSQTQVYHYSLAIQNTIRQYESRMVPYSQNEVLAIVRDITESIRAERDLRENEKKYRDLFNNLRDAVGVVDLQGHYIDANPVYLEILGYRLEELKQLDYQHLTPLKWENEEKKYVDQILNQGYSNIYEKEYIRKDGSVFPVELRSYLIRDLDEKPVGMVGIARDITDRKKVENDLQKSEKLYRLLAQNAADVIWILDTENFRFRYISPSIERLRGYTAEEIMAKDLDSLTDEKTMEYIHQKMPQRVREFQEGLIKVYIDEIRQKHRDGSWIWTEVKTHFIINEDSGHLEIYGISRNIDERKQAEKSQKQLLDEKDVLLRELQHRVKNNLNVVYSLLGLEIRRLKDDDAKAIFLDAQSRIQAMSKIYEKLYQSNNLELLELSSYIKDFARSVFNLYLLNSKFIQLQMQIEDIKLDLKRAVPLGLILNELLSNSLKHAFPNNQAGMISISLGLYEDQLQLIVEDNGMGLPRDFNVETVSSMGFQLVRILAQQLDASFSISANTPQGSVFRISFKV